MRRCRALVLLSVALIASGCTHDYVLELGAAPAAYADANRITSNREAEVLTQEGQLFRWYGVRLSPDSTRGLVPASGVRPPAIVTSSVTEISLRSRGRGVVEGAAIGAGIGVALGLLIGPDDATCSDLCASTRGEQAFQLGVGSALWGVIIGAIRASRTKIRVR